MGLALGGVICCFKFLLKIKAVALCADWGYAEWLGLSWKALKKCTRVYVVKLQQCLDVMMQDCNCNHSRDAAPGHFLLLARSLGLGLSLTQNAYIKSLMHPCVWNIFVLGYSVSHCQRRSTQSSIGSVHAHTHLYTPKVNMHHSR